MGHDVVLGSGARVHGGSRRPSAGALNSNASTVTDISVRLLPSTTDRDETEDHGWVELTLPE